MTAAAPADASAANLVQLAASSKAWPFEEARRLVKRLERLPQDNKKTVIFETGYGPSGLPHIGTFGEVARTSMVRHAFEILEFAACLGENRTPLGRLTGHCGSADSILATGLTSSATREVA